MEQFNKQVLEDLLTLTTYPEWQVFIEQVEERMEQLKDSALFTLETEQDIVRAQTEYATLNRIYNTREFVQKVLEELDASV